MEIYSIETLTLTDKQFLLGERDGKPVRIGAELRLPPGTARIPAVVLIHGPAVSAPTLTAGHRNSRR